MNLPTVAIAIFLAGGCAFGRANPIKTSETSEKVIVCLENPESDLRAWGAESMASGMLKKVGVGLQWRNSERACQSAGPGAIVVKLLPHAASNAGRVALAYAYYREGVHIEVFLDRISTFPSDLQTLLLAHVLVHEITHILQGISRHSATGMMKAQWDSDDYYEMRSHPLRFTPEDIRLIHAGLAARAAAR
jgi:hypothetical protein